MENTQIKLSETVMVIDVAYLNFVINDLRKYFEPLLGRSLQTVDLALFTMYLAMDAGLKGSDNDVQVLLVYDKQSGKLEHCLPSDLKNELDGVAFKASLGEFSFMAVPSEGFVSRGDLYLDLLQIVLNAAEVKKLIVVPFNEEYGKEVENVLRECALYNPQIQISAESETKRSIFREKDKTKRSKKESAQHSKSRNKSFVMTSVSAL